jgi:hypothetical protein
LKPFLFEKVFSLLYDHFFLSVIFFEEFATPVLQKIIGILYEKEYGFFVDDHMSGFYITRAVGPLAAEG